MARSRRKPYYTDQQTNSPGRQGRVALAKRRANRKVRAEGKKAVEGRDEADIADGASFKKVHESWDIRDWSFYTPNDPKAKRK